MKTLVFDMDGTIADLYSVDDWLKKLRSYSAEPYKMARPMYDMDKLNDCLLNLKNLGWRIEITTWVSMETTPVYTEEVAKAKKEWLDKYHFPYDGFNATEYGVLKETQTSHLGGYQVLVDDNAEVRESWSLGATIDANNDILEELLLLAKKTIDNEI